MQITGSFCRRRPSVMHSSFCLQGRSSWRASEQQQPRASTGTYGQRRHAAATPSFLVEASSSNKSSPHAWHVRMEPSARPAALKAVVFAVSEDDSVELELKVEGMMCGGCSGRVEEAIKKMANVKHVAVNLETKLAQVEVRAASQLDALAIVPSLIQAVKDLGFEAEPHFGS